MGSRLRDGLSDFRAGAPRPQLWQAISRELEPPTPKGRVSAWLSLPPRLAGANPQDWERNRLRLAYTSLVSGMALVYTLALGSLMLDGRNGQRFVCDGNCPWDSLSSDEIARQTTLDPSGVNAYPGWVFQVRPARTLPMEPGTEHYEARYWVEWGRTDSRPVGVTGEVLASPDIVMD